MNLLKYNNIKKNLNYSTQKFNHSFLKKMNKKGQTSDGLRITVGIILLIAFFAIIIYIFLTKMNLTVPK